VAGNEDLNRLSRRAIYLYGEDQRRIGIQDYVDIMDVVKELRKLRGEARRIGRLVGMVDSG